MLYILLYKDKQYMMISVYNPQTDSNGGDTDQGRHGTGLADFDQAVSGGTKARDMSLHCRGSGHRSGLTLLAGVSLVVGSCVGVSC